MYLDNHVRVYVLPNTKTLSILNDENEQLNKIIIFTLCIIYLYLVDVIISDDLYYIIVFMILLLPAGS